MVCIGRSQRWLNADILNSEVAEITGALHVVEYYPVTFEFSVSLEEKRSLFLPQSL